MVQGSNLTGPTQWPTEPIGKTKALGPHTREVNADYTTRQLGISCFKFILKPYCVTFHPVNKI